MQAFIKIIVEKANGQWAAWFHDVPQIASGGEWPSDAIDRLLEHYGEDQFEREKIVSVEDGIRHDHLEFLIPLRGRRRIPIPSTN